MSSIELVIHPHPILRHRSKPIARVDKELKDIAEEMFRIMYALRGVGLASNQVALPIRMFVCNPTGVREEGQEMVFINPVITKQKGIQDAEEGCLSLPGVNAAVKRSKSLWINAYDLLGKEIDTEVNGFLARIIQHETDHLDGVLFVDRLSSESVKCLEPAIDTLVEDYTSRQRTGSLESDAILMEKSMAWEQKYC
jgi:peptide deformylase